MLWKLYLLVALCCLMSFVFGMILAKLLWMNKFDCVLHIDTHNPDTDKYKFIVLCPLDDLSNKSYMYVKVIKDI